MWAAHHVQAALSDESSPCLLSVPPHVLLHLRDMRARVVEELQVALQERHVTLQRRACVRAYL